MARIYREHKLAGDSNIYNIVYCISNFRLLFLLMNKKFIEKNCVSANKVVYHIRKTSHLFVTLLAFKPEKNLFAVTKYMLINIETSV